MTEPARPERPKSIGADPRTDDVNDLGMYDLDPPSDEEVAAGVEHDRERAGAAADGERGDG